MITRPSCAAPGDHGVLTEYTGLFDLDHYHAHHHSGTQRSPRNVPVGGDVCDYYEHQGGLPESKAPRALEVEKAAWKNDRL